MEVHHHAHTSRKKWTHYLWEFLMLFLAVFCGFLAEYQLEHTIEKDREKQYIQSLYFDLQKDINQTDSLIKQQVIVKEICDSLPIWMTGREFLENSYPVYKRWRLVLGFNDFISNDGTMQQLKNSGSLRLIHEQNVVNKLMDYSKVTEVIRIHQSTMNDFLLQDRVYELFDIPALDKTKGLIPVPPINTEKHILSWAYDHIKTWKSLLAVWNVYLQKVRQTGIELSELINEEYSVKQH